MKVQILVFMLLILAVTGYSQVTLRSDNDTVAVQEIKDLEYYLAGLIEKGDVDTYSGYLADDYVRVAANGTISTKEQVIEGFRKSKSRVTMVPHDLNVRVYGNTAIMQGILDLETKSGDTITKRSSVIIKVFIKKNDKWYLASLQGTAL